MSISKDNVRKYLQKEMTMSIENVSNMQEGTFIAHLRFLPYDIALLVVKNINPPNKVRGSSVEERVSLSDYYVTIYLNEDGTQIQKANLVLPNQNYKLLRNAIKNMEVYEVSPGGMLYQLAKIIKDEENKIGEKRPMGKITPLIGQT